MAAFVKYNSFVADIANKIHNLGSDSLKVALSNRAPVVATDNSLATATEIAAGNGYTAGGNAAALISSAQSGGTYALKLSDPATWTAAGGSIGPFRYAILYNATAAGTNLIGYWDYGSAVTLAVGETFVADLDNSNGVFTLA